MRAHEVAIFLAENAAVSPAYGNLQRVLVMTPDGPRRIDRIVREGGTQLIVMLPLDDVCPCSDWDCMGSPRNHGKH